jgi:hypothetical protein
VDLEAQGVAGEVLEARGRRAAGRALGLECGVDDFAQLAQVVRAGVDLQQFAAAAQHARELGVDREAEHAQHAVERGRQHRQAGVAADDPGGGRIGAGPAAGVLQIALRRRLHRPLRDVEAGERERARFHRRRGGELAQVVALAAAGVEAGERLAGGRALEHGARHRSGDRRVMPGLEEAPARGDHLLAVAGVARALVLHRQQVHIALGGEVEAVPVRAAQAAALALQRRAVERAGEGGEGSGGHGRRSSMEADAMIGEAVARRRAARLRASRATIGRMTEESCRCMHPKPC